MIEPRKLGPQRLTVDMGKNMNESKVVFFFKTWCAGLRLIFQGLFALLLFSILWAGITWMLNLGLRAMGFNEDQLAAKVIAITVTVIFVPILAEFSIGAVNSGKRTNELINEEADNPHDRTS